MNRRNLGMISSLKRSVPLRFTPHHLLMSYAEGSEVAMLLLPCHGVFHPHSLPLLSRRPKGAPSGG